MNKNDAEVNYLKELLANNKMTIEFTKSDGTLRKMFCTLMPDELPKIEVKEDAPPKKKRKAKPEVISVYDLEKKGWRSFRIESITAYTFPI